MKLSFWLAFPQVDQEKFDKINKLSCNDLQNYQFFIGTSETPGPAMNSCWRDGKEDGNHDPREKDAALSWANLATTLLAMESVNCRLGLQVIISPYCKWNNQHLY